MKKNISINISGIIFHIEEEGYETLKKYLDSINRYFSSFEDSSEILADIESRIAEIFLSKLNEDKQVITAEDVNALVATMGSVNDFRAAEDQNNESDPLEEGKTQTNSGNTNKFNPPYTPPKRLLRDQKRKILGGVCSGLGNYLNVDALWIRLLFALLTFAYGLPILVYAIMWILIPGSYDLDEPVVSKKMFRDPERKVIGGVSSGVAAYLGVDIVGMRIIFVLLTFAGGFGLFLYIVLWMILPEARTLTDKMQMQGEAVTLSNIESTLKKNQSEQPVAEETVITKILLFPFRLLGMILQGLAQILRPLVEVIRVAIGVLVSFLGVSLMFSIMVTAGILFGIFSSSAFSLPWMAEYNEASVPVDAFLRAFPGWTAVAAFFVALIPCIYIILLGVSIIAKRIVFNATVGWALFVVLFINIAVLSVGIPKLVFAFKEEADFRIENTYKVNGKTAVLTINQSGMDDYDAVNLDLQGHDEPHFKLVQTFEAQGSSRAKAIENAKMVEYNVDVQDSVFRFDSNLKFKDDAIFRAQRLKMKLFIPYDFPFTMDEEMSRFIDQYVDSRYLEGETWALTRESGLTCVTCPQEENNYTDLRDFDEVEIKGKFDVRIVTGHNYNVKVNGSERAKNRYDVTREGETLIVEYNADEFKVDLKNLNVDEVELVITMPTLERVEAVGVGTIKLDEISSDDLEIDLRGPITVRGEINAHNLDINLSGSAEADLKGNANNMNARVELASKLRAYNFEVVNAFVETSGASTAKVFVTQQLEMEQGPASKIEYRGNANIIRRD
ncbi:MAG TPA: PspC domain-containing protein [Chryseosolibacter sp.]|nr:PspC domain-containing protein [Chryseosolibacter sp.]